MKMLPLALDLMVSPASCSRQQALPQVTHGAKGETTDHGVAIAAVLLQRVDRKERELGVRLCVIAKVEVHELLLHEVLRGRRLDGGGRTGVEDDGG